MVLHIRDFPADLAKWLKIEAAKRETATYQLIINILREYQERTEKEEGK